MDAKTIIHVGAEILVIGGVSFWFHKRIGDQNVIITKLVDDNKKLTERIDALERFVTEQHQMIQQLMSGYHQPSVNVSQAGNVPKPKVSKPKPTVDVKTNMPDNDQQPPPPKPKVKRRVKQTPSLQPAESKVQELNDDVDIDALLADEISRVEQERNNHLETSNENDPVSEASINDGELRTVPGEYVEDGSTNLPYSSS